MVLLSHEEFRQWSTSRVKYERHRPETTLLYQIIQEHWPRFQAELGSKGKHLPKFVTQEFEEYLKCGRLEHGFLRVECESCHHEKLVAFSCKRRGFCPSCGARRMADSAAHLVDEVLPEKPIRQWVLSVPFQLRYLFATRPEVMSKVLAIVHRVISTFLIKRAELTVNSDAQTGAVTLIQRFGRSGVPGALNLNLHYHMLYLFVMGSFCRYALLTHPKNSSLSSTYFTIALLSPRLLSGRSAVRIGSGGPIPIDIIEL